MKHPEEWKAMKEFDEIYHISNHGRVKSYMVDKEEGRIILPKITARGYTSYVIKYNGHYQSFYAHRKVGEYFIPNPNGYATIDHIKNDKSLNQAWELQWMDQIDNCRKDQSRIVICTSPLGVEHEAEGTRHAAQIASCNRSSVQYSIKNNKTTINGWSFKYKKK
jgi:hypothetical protein